MTTSASEIRVISSFNIFPRPLTGKSAVKQCYILFVQLKFLFQGSFISLNLSSGELLFDGEDAEPKFNCQFPRNVFKLFFLPRYLVTAT